MTGNPGAMSRYAVMTVIVLLGRMALSAQSAPLTRWVCVAPVRPTQGSTAAAPGLACSSEVLSLKIDGGDAKPWPRASSARTDGLDLRTPHKVVVMCDGKPQQTLRFKFSEFKSNDLCLFLNDLYG